jgi:HEAT repeat protein
LPGRAHSASLLRTPGPNKQAPKCRTFAELDDDDFSVRERASAELGKLGGAAHWALRKVLEGQPSAEVRQRAQHLLERHGAADASPDLRRRARSLELVERLGTADARRLLEELAKGAPGAALTEAARTSLARLSRQ